MTMDKLLDVTDDSSISSTMGAIPHMLDILYLPFSLLYLYLLFLYIFIYWYFSFLTSFQVVMALRPTDDLILKQLNFSF